MRLCAAILLIITFVACKGKPAAKAALPKKELPETMTATVANGTQTAELYVNKGYRPAHIKAKAGMPLELHVFRTKKEGCGGTLVIKDAKVVQELTDDAWITVKVPALPPGKHRFSCGMNMYDGEIEIEGAPAGVVGASGAR